MARVGARCFSKEMFQKAGAVTEKVCFPGSIMQHCLMEKPEACQFYPVLQACKKQWKTDGPLNNQALCHVYSQSADSMGAMCDVALACRMASPIRWAKRGTHDNKLLTSRWKKESTRIKGTLTKGWTFWTKMDKGETHEFHLGSPRLFNATWTTVTYAFFHFSFSKCYRQKSPAIQECINCVCCRDFLSACLICTLAVQLM